VGADLPFGRLERLNQLAQRTADAMNYAKYWKDRAGEAIRKHNAHIEGCNRVIEAGETGMHNVSWVHENSRSEDSPDLCCN
jgi:hypothetical protein